MDLHDTIEDAVNDATNPDSAPVEQVDDVTVEASPDDTSTEQVEIKTDEPVEDNQTEVASPASKGVSEIADEFAAKFGLQSQSVTGRENRIPYSRVKKIVEKNEKETIARVTKELEQKFSVPQAEVQAKLTDYEGRLEKVAQFENILQNDPRQFLQMLSQVPAYKDFFEFVSKAVSGEAPQQQTAPDPMAEMPQPGPDGLYDMNGLKKLLAWQADQVEQRTIKQVEERYKPIEQEWQSREQYNKIVPVVEKQIAEARTWPRFSDFEKDIVVALKADPNLSLEGAYRKVVVPVIMGDVDRVREEVKPDRDKMRTELLAEIKKRPVASSAGVGQTRPNPVSTGTGPRNLEDVIAASLADHQQ